MAENLVDGRRTVSKDSRRLQDDLSELTDVVG
jgi:hypothetical protein